MKKERNIFMTKPGELPTTKKTIHELAKEFPDKTYRELEKYREKDRAEEVGQCIMGEMRKDREDLDWKIKYDKEHKLRQEAEGELTIVKGISVHMSPEMRDAQKKIKELQNSLDRFKKDNNHLYNRIAELIEANEKEVKNLKWIKDHDYIFLIDENKKLHAEIKKLKEGIVDRARKAGL